MDAVEHIRTLATAARLAGMKLAVSPGAQRSAALRAAAESVRREARSLKAANAKDLATAGEMGLAEAMLVFQVIYIFGDLC